MENQSDKREGLFGTLSNVIQIAESSMGIRMGQGVDGKMARNKTIEGSIAQVGLMKNMF